jgi:pimeloyl-ACP methyl ester carboxylesterase
MILLIHLSGCATTAYLFDKGAFCEAAAEKSGFRKELIDTGDFTILAYSRIKKLGMSLVIYIEGDGSAWETRTRLSEDPTPRDPLVIKLAAIDPSPNVAYLARPGQYTLIGASSCNPSYWSDERFSETVVKAMDQAVEHLKSKYGAKEVSLIGYSGGGAIAVLVAARRGDITKLRTVAGNLDHVSVSNYHGVSSLGGSLNPIDVATGIAILPQRHFAGESDNVIPSFIARSFVKRAGDKNYDRVIIVKGATHSAGWVEQWAELLEIPVD